MKSCVTSRANNLRLILSAVVAFWGYFQFGAGCNLARAQTGNGSGNGVSSLASPSGTEKYIAHFESFGGQHLTLAVPTPECAKGVERAVRENRVVPGTNPECEQLMFRALWMGGHHVHPTILTVAGHSLTMPTSECANAVERALREDRVISGTDGECENLMVQALEIERNAPPPEHLVPGYLITPPPPMK
jgi:hypothetical protein